MAELYLYEVPHRGQLATVKLSVVDAESIYGDAARRIRPLPVAVPQPVAQQSWTPGVEPAEKKATPARNKARTADAGG